jgi:hypothetical protein
MINIIIATLALVILPMFGGFLVTIGLGNLFSILSILWFSRSRSNIMALILILICSLIFDAGMGIFFGGNALLIFLLFSIYLLFEKFFPMHNDVVKYAGIFVILIVGNAGLSFLTRNAVNIQLVQDSSYVVGILKASFIDVIIVVVVNFIVDFFSVSSVNSIKIR